eukprot:5013657-Pleurochrysis_carterae.AAC.1
MELAAAGSNGRWNVDGADDGGESDWADSVVSRRQRARPSPSALKLTSPPIDPCANRAAIAASLALSSAVCVVASAALLCGLLHVKHGGDAIAEAASR